MLSDVKKRRTKYRFIKRFAHIIKEQLRSVERTHPTEFGKYLYGSKRTISYIQGVVIKGSMVQLYKLGFLALINNFGLKRVENGCFTSERTCISGLVTKFTLEKLLKSSLSEKYVIHAFNYAGKAVFNKKCDETRTIQGEKCDGIPIAYSYSPERETGKIILTIPMAMHATEEWFNVRRRQLDTISNACPMLRRLVEKCIYWVDVIDPSFDTNESMLVDLISSLTTIK